MEQVTGITVEETDDGKLVVELTEHNHGSMRGEVKSRKIVEPPFSINLQEDHELVKEGRRRFTVDGTILADVSEYDE